MPPARTARSSTSCPASTRRAARCTASSRRHAAELDHNFLWRYWDKVPARGRIGIFNRSYYEEVLVVKVHPQHPRRGAPAAGAMAGGSFWDARYDDINRFERHLARNGTAIVKFFLNVSKAEQKRRLLERSRTTDKHWKFSAADLEERGYWRDYMAAYQDMLRATSTDWAPWYVIPADHKYVARALVAAILSGTIGALGLRLPESQQGRRARARGRAAATARQRLRPPGLRRARTAPRASGSAA